MLRGLDVMVESADRGFGATYDGDLRVLLQSQRRMMAEAGFVRFADGDWWVEACESDDGHTLALPLGKVSRPRSQ